MRTPVTKKKTVRFKLCHALQTIDNIVSVFFSADILPRYLFHCHEWWQNSFPISIAFLLPSSAFFSRSHTIWHSLLYFLYILFILYIHTHARIHTVGCPAAIFERFIMYFGQTICLHTIGKINSHYRNYSKPPSKHAQLTHIDCDSNIRHNLNRDHHAKQFIFCNKTPYNIGIELNGMAFFYSKLTALYVNFNMRSSAISTLRRHWFCL